MVRFEWDKDALAKVINNAVQVRADELQAVYDRVSQAGRGKSLEDVKQLLQAEVRSTIGTVITDPELSDCAEVLAAGRRIVVRREDVRL
jgi:hypothetical protein